VAKDSLEYYGATKGMPIDILNTRLKKAQADTDELSLELLRRKNFTEAEKLADRLHRLLHFAVDCDFYYSDWPNPTGCRAEFRTLAEEALLWYDRVAQPGTLIRMDYPLGQLIHFLEVARFGQMPL
jgi:hypothetical protein